LPDERLQRIRGELMDACAHVGRDPATLGITVGLTVRYPDHAAAEGTEDQTPSKALVGSPEEIAEGLAAHAAQGTDHVIASLDPCTPATVALFAQAVERFRARP
jgi:alkanesulfonate monooxygenase SsuD/methylene tetrahydromethanopterin reductase-like flavin-dependent oxidoreductase (luciferase family)